VDTTRNILGIVTAVALLVIGLALMLIATLGLGVGLLVGAGIAAVALAHYGLKLRPWHRRWGATYDEAHAPLPGDDLVPDAPTTTRGVAIAAPPEAVWPWLVQIGWGKAGWYSYDWIDNDGRPSADAIVPEWQDLAVGDRIPMTPDIGFVVRQLDPPHDLVALSDDGSTSWCLHLTPDGEGSRLLSRFRNHTQVTPASALWLLVSDPGVFIMERKMLLGIAARAEAPEVEVLDEGTSVPLPVVGHGGECDPVSVGDAEDFLAGEIIAVVGASDDRGNMGGAILRELWLHGHRVVPVHPTARLVGGHRCYPTIADVPGPVDGAVVVLPAGAAVDVVGQCIAAGVPAIWLFKGIGGEGAVSDEAIALCHEAGIPVVPGACPLMFIQPVGTIHRIHRAARRARGTLVATGG
jgi:predicted CoA-binding protein